MSETRAVTESSVRGEQELVGKNTGRTSLEANGHRTHQSHFAHRSSLHDEAGTGTAYDPTHQSSGADCTARSKKVVAPSASWRKSQRSFAYCTSTSASRGHTATAFSRHRSAVM